MTDWIGPQNPVAIDDPYRPVAYHPWADDLFMAHPELDSPWSVMAEALNALLARANIDGAILRTAFRVEHEGPFWWRPSSP